MNANYRKVRSILERDAARVLHPRRPVPEPVVHDLTPSRRHRASPNAHSFLDPTPALTPGPDTHSHPHQPTARARLVPHRLFPALDAQYVAPVRPEAAKRRAGDGILVDTC